MPTSFNTLLSKATPGPFRASDANSGEICVYQALPIGRDGTTTYRILFRSEWASLEDAELVARLLNAAHEGKDIVYEAAKFTEAFIKPEEAKDMSTTPGRLWHVWAILNGEKTIQ